MDHAMKINIQYADFRNITKRDVLEMQNVLEYSPSASIFHSVEWNRCLINYFNLPHTLVLAKENGRLAGFCIMFPITKGTIYSPAVHLQNAYGGPVAVNDEPAIIRNLLEGIEWIYPMAYFKIWSPPFINRESFTACGYQSEEMLTSIVNLENSEAELWGNLHRNKRYMVRKAASCNLKLMVGGLEHLDDYHIMAVETLSHGGVSALPLDFVGAVIKELGPLGMVKLLLVKSADEIVSGSIILHYKRTAYGWDIGWRREYATLSPNDFLVWEAMLDSKREGARYFDLLRIEPDRLPGIAKWKETFGGEIVPCYLLRKETIAFKFVKPVKILFTEPQRAFGKLRKLVKS